MLLRMFPGALGIFFFILTTTDSGKDIAGGKRKDTWGEILSRRPEIEFSESGKRIAWQRCSIREDWLLSMVGTNLEAGMEVLWEPSFHHKLCSWMVFPWTWERSCKILHPSINPMPSYPPMVFPPVLSTNNWHTSLYKFKAYCVMVWFMYIMKSLWFIIFSYHKSFCQVCCNWRGLCAGVMEDKKWWSKMTNGLKISF